MLFRNYRESLFLNEKKCINILFAVYAPVVLRAFENVIRSLCGMGHQVKVLYGYNGGPLTLDRVLKRCQSELSNFEAMPMLNRKKWSRLSNVRELIDYANYFPVSFRLQCFYCSSTQLNCHCNP